MKNPTKEEALQFCLMLSSGMPASQAIRYFFHPDVLAGMADKDLYTLVERWLHDEEVQSAQLVLAGKSWQQMLPDERITYAIEKHYNEMAYFLYANNYNELRGELKAKADSCRLALEAKIAGTAGKDPLSQFYADVKAGRVGQKPGIN